MTDMFRKREAQGASSTEALDALLCITTPRGWAALALLGFCLLGALAWGIWGRLPYSIAGQGILLYPGGLFSIKAGSSGELEELYVNVGDTVSARQRVARIAHDDTLASLQGAQKNVDDLRSKYNLAKSLGQDDLTKNTASLDMQITQARFLIASARTKIARLEARLVEQTELQKLGLITRNALESSREELESTRAEVFKNQSVIEQLQAQKSQAQNDLTKQLLELERQISLATSELAVKQAEYRAETTILSPYDGVVVSVDADLNDIIPAGQPIVTVTPKPPHSLALNAELFFAAGEAKRIQPGMLAHIAPGTVKVDKYGYVLGTVVRVGEYPATSVEINRVLQNDALVSSMLSAGPVIAVEVTLIQDPGTPSGFRWTSSNGPPATLQAGIMCNALTITEENPPITLVMPMLKRFLLGLD